MPDLNFALFKTNQLQLVLRNHFRVRHHTPHALKKIAKVAPCLESEQIELEQGAQQPLLLRELLKNVVCRKGDMKKKGQRRKVLRYASLAQRLSYIHQVIIMHPDEIAPMAVSCDDFCVTPVHRLVGLPESRLEIAEALQIMKQRPNDLV